MGTKKLHFLATPDGAVRIKAFSAIWWLLRVRRRDLLLDPFLFGSVPLKMDKSLLSARAGWAGRGVVGSGKLPAAALIKSERICFYEAALFLALLKMEDEKHLSPWPGLACCMLMVFTCRVNIIACLIHCPLLTGGVRACAYVLFGISKTLS